MVCVFFRDESATPARALATRLDLPYSGRMDQGQDKHPRRIMHLDMDAFYASVEQRDNPELRGKPVIVGGMPEEGRGVVSACSYEARAFGVRSAMPTMQAKRLCPNAIFVRGSMSKYVAVSKEVMAVLGRFSPVVQQASIDEAYLDITGTEGLFGTSLQLAQTLKDEVRSATDLACSVGIAPLKFLAKIASDYDKPDGIFIIEPDEVDAFLLTMPVGKIPGVGKRCLATLQSMNVLTAGDVRKYSPEFWRRQLGKGGEVLHRRSNGVDESEVVTYTKAKSESAENTFRSDTSDPVELKRWLMLQAERVGASLRKHNTPGRTITLKLKYSDFTSITRSKTLSKPTFATETIFETAARLLDKQNLSKTVRLIGVGVSNFDNPQQQLSLFDVCGGDDLPGATDGKQERLDEALDKIRDKFGKEKLIRGRIFDFKK